MDISAITQYKPAVDSHLVSYLRSRQKISINTYETDLIEKLVQFVTAGKTIRGSLVMFGYTMYGGKTIEPAIAAAAAAELFHSGFLIHDDIMDTDEIRRGKPSIHMQYASAGASRSHQYGVNMGINAGDYCFFLAYQLLTQDPANSSAVTHIFSQEFSRVVAAQMADVSGPVATIRLSEDEILDIYRYKTARYTFSLPLCVGATLGHASAAVVQSLEKLGENVGLLFQIRDDELNAFGTAQKSGKPVGSDRATRKQTLIDHFLRSEYPSTDLVAMTDQDFANLYRKSESAKKIQHIKQIFAESVAHTIDTLAIDDAHKLSLRALAEFVQTREN